MIILKINLKIFIKEEIKFVEYNLNNKFFFRIEIVDLG